MKELITIFTNRRSIFLINPPTRTCRSFTIQIFYALTIVANEYLNTIFRCQKVNVVPTVGSISAKPSLSESYNWWHSHEVSS